ncbi:MAG: LssY C-terminal domain-containing protein [Actinomycetota bacterium]|nr:LssY C-terminal domain-containing protein [Actinomycetota bacterium]
MAKTRSALTPPPAAGTTTGPQVDHAIDWVFFVLGGLAAVWLAWVLVRESFSFGWWQIAFVVGFWGALAYLVLPRLHRILTSIYVPDYFIGRARTSDGLLGDPVNLALHGTEAQVHEAMENAGWIRADDLTLTTGWNIVRSTLSRKSYLRAPVSPLLLFGRQQDFAYQQEVDGSPGKRHHVRFWRCPDGWKLPGGHPADWLAAGTYDKSVGLSLYTLQITHKIADDTDAERDFIVKTVLDAEPAASVSVIRDFSTGYHSRNGGGDSIVTDGDLPVLDVRKVEAVEEKAVAPVTDSRDIRPAATVLGAILVAIGAVIGIVSGVMQVAVAHDEALELATERDELEVLGVLLTAVGVFIIAVAVVQLLLALRVYRGSNRARVFVMVFASIAIITLIIGAELGDTASVTDNLPGVALNVLALLTLSSERAMAYARRLHPGRRDRAVSTTTA